MMQRGNDNLGWVSVCLSVGEVSKSEVSGADDKEWNSCANRRSATKDILAKGTGQDDAGPVRILDGFPLVASSDILACPLRR